MTNSTSKKLPKAITIMVEKNNLVMAIKTLAADENISMDEAKARIDDYEAQLKAKQQQNVAKIAKKQGVQPQAQSAVENLQAGLDKHLNTTDYQTICSILGQTVNDNFVGYGNYFWGVI